MNAVQLTRDLSKIPSPSGEERAIGIFLQNRLQKNFNVRMQRVGQRFNILATVGSPRLLLTTHMDTVPGEIPLREDATFLYGRGVSDAKASMAAMIAAGEEAKKEGCTNFGLLFDVGEEDDFAGIKKATRLVKPSVVVVGEPTNLKTLSGQKGFIGVTVMCKGKASHASTPEKGSSAIETLLWILAKMQKVSLPKNRFGKTTLNIGTIQGGTAANVVPDSATAEIDIRTTCPTSTVITLLSKTIPNTCLKITACYEPVLPQDGSGTIAPYFTEMYFWRTANVIILGPGDSAYAHKSNERIRKKDIEKGKERYLDLMRRHSSKQFR